MHTNEELIMFTTIYPLSKQPNELDEDIERTHQLSSGHQITGDAPEIHCAAITSIPPCYLVNGEFLVFSLKVVRTNRGCACSCLLGDLSLIRTLFEKKLKCIQPPWCNINTGAPLASSKWLGHIKIIAQVL